MCGRFTLRTPGNQVIDQFDLDFDGNPGELVPRYNIAPTQNHLVVRNANREATFMKWGLVPFWSKDPKGGAKMINARSETITTKPAFRNAAKRKRCLVPADGYFEWVREGKKKKPFWIRMADERPFMMAGLWEEWRDKSIEDSASLETFTILTTASNSLTSDIHDRMPVILHKNDYDPWLDPNVEDANEFTYLFEPYDSDQMRLDEVNDRVNSVRNDDEQCVEIMRGLF